MQTHEVLYANYLDNEITKNCIEFLNNRSSLPLLKYLPSSYPNTKRVKVRKRKPENISPVYDEAFDNLVTTFRRRVVITNGTLSCSNNNMELFYIFPVDGYKFLYAPRITNSSTDFTEAMRLIQSTVGDANGQEIVAELLKFSYTNMDIVTGIASGAEIIIHDIPAYYAIRVSTSDQYTELTEKLINYNINK